MGGMSSELFRVWFCTLCNNQSRIQEEIGTNLESSSFMQVLKSDTCRHFALISPLEALKRKWCAFELSLSIERQKLRNATSILLVTDDGVVQDGQVAPDRLLMMARGAQNFKAENATCWSSEDSKMIDSFVHAGGGYDLITATVKKAILQALSAAEHI